MARFFSLLAMARSEDLPEVLSALPAEIIVAGLSAATPSLPDAVVDHVIAEGPHVARLALARRVQRFPRWEPKADHTQSAAMDSLSRRLRKLDDPHINEALLVGPNSQQPPTPPEEDPPRPAKGTPGYEDWIAHWNTPGTVSSTPAPDWDDILTLTDPDHLGWETYISGEPAWFPARSVGLDEAMQREDIPADVVDRITAAYRMPPPPMPRPDLGSVLRYMRWSGAAHGFEEHLAAEVIRGMRVGTLTPGEVFEHVEPPRVVPDLLLPDRGRSGRGDAPRAQLDLRDLITARLADRLGTDVSRWTSLIIQVARFRRTSLATLIDEVATAPLPPETPPGPATWRNTVATTTRAPTTLLSLAPADVAAGVLHRIPDLAQAVILGDLARADDRADRLRLYAWLAELAGPEPVWTIELDHAGSLDAMEAAVRASMAAGDASPLSRAVGKCGPGSPFDETQAADPTWIVAHLVRDRLDGRPDRWLLLAETLCAANGDASADANHHPADGAPDDLVIAMINQTCATLP